MPLFDDIGQLRSQGFGEREIIDALAKKGFSPKEIAQALAETQIKEAVVGEGLPLPSPQFPPAPQQNQQDPQEYQQNQELPPPQEPSSQYQSYAPPDNQQYASYDAYAQGGISADTITEIAEQTVLEKLSPLRQRLEESLNLKNSFDARFEYLEDRLKRIEKIIDRLQLSVLQKVGSYITNVEDIKQEIEETQKTFKSLIDRHKK